MTTDDEPRIDVVPEATIIEVCGDRELPSMGLVEQVWETDPVPDDALEDQAAAAVDAFDLDGVPRGGEVAVGVGSRGVANIPVIARGVVEELADRGYEPFVFPAMGSHGGATAEGQRATLDALGVNERSLGCGIRATMDVVEVGTTPDRGVPVLADANAAAADAIVPINRVKAHTDFDGAVESGLSKMLVIGMGKQKGAKRAHEWAVDWSFRNMIPEITALHLEALPVVGGVALVEDQHHDTAVVEGVPPEGFLDREAELLELAYDLMPRIPFEELDLLVVDQQGKDISGAGLDPNITGRRPYGLNEPDPESPTVKRIYTRSLTPASHGNATGLAGADVIHADLLADANLSDTLINAITGSAIRGAMVPPVVETDRAGIVAALSTVGVVDPGTVRVARVTDTMRLERLYASSALVEAARDRDDLRVVAEPEPISFDDAGNLVSPSPSADD